MSIHPQIIEKNGVREYAVIPYDEFLRIQEELEDFDDLKTLREEKTSSREQPSRTLDSILADPLD